MDIEGGQSKLIKTNQKLTLNTRRANVLDSCGVAHGLSAVNSVEN